MITEKSSDEEIRDEARGIYGEEGTLDIDEDAHIDRGHDDPEQGAYVQAWVWVAFEKPEGNTEEVEG